jgi:hypothetical protein
VKSPAAKAAPAHTASAKASTAVEPAAKAATAVEPAAAKAATSAGAPATEPSCKRLGREAGTNGCQDDQAEDLFHSLAFNWIRIKWNSATDFSPTRSSAEPNEGSTHGWRGKPTDKVCQAAWFQDPVFHPWYCHAIRGHIPVFQIDHHFAKPSVHIRVNPCSIRG